MKVYHGGYTAIENIDFSFSRKRRDFGKGFYVTKLLSQAEFWAARKGEDNDTEGVVTEFEFDEDSFDDDMLNTLRFDGYTQAWLDFVVCNRLNKKNEQAHGHDIVEGPVADDNIAARVYDYLAKKISREDFLLELTHKTPTHQICFCTVRSLQALKLNKDHVDVETIHTDNDVVKSLMADFGLSESTAMDVYYTSSTYTRLANESTRLWLKPWRDIYEMLITELNEKKAIPPFSNQPNPKET